MAVSCGSDVAAPVSSPGRCLLDSDRRLLPDEGGRRDILGHSHYHHDQEKRMDDIWSVRHATSGVVMDDPNRARSMQFEHVSLVSSAASPLYDIG